jgi:hypothetical protein
VCGTVSYLPPEGILALDNKHLGYVGSVFRYYRSRARVLTRRAGCLLIVGAQG